MDCCRALATRQGLAHRLGRPKAHFFKGTAPGRVGSRDQSRGRSAKDVHRREDHRRALRSLDFACADAFGSISGHGSQHPELPGDSFQGWRKRCRRGYNCEELLGEILAGNFDETIARDSLRSILDRFGLLEPRTSSTCPLTSTPRGIVATAPGRDLRNSFLFL